MNNLLSLTLLATSAVAIAVEPELVSLKDACPAVRTPKMRKNNSCFVRPEVAERLKAVQQELEKMGLGLKVYEGYCEMCDEECMLNSDGCTVALPEECNRHCLGTSVDVTLVTKKGKELEMPCAFDDFCNKAKRSYMNLSDHVLANRELLEKVMVKHGFIASENSWWHFDIADWQEFSTITRSNCDCQSCTCSPCTCSMQDCAMVCTKSCSMSDCSMACDRNCTMSDCETDCATTCPMKSSKKRSKSTENCTKGCPKK